MFGNVVFMLIAFVSAVSAFAADVRVDWETEVGSVKPVNGVGQPPMVGALGDWPMFGYLRRAGVPYSRLHDVGGWLGGGLYVDIPNLFPDFDADENDPKNYRFQFTDSLMTALDRNGVEPFFRLGVTIENFVGYAGGYPALRTKPPKDFAKWARICEHVIRHYTEGWSDGFRLKVTHWEIWNEPENDPVDRINPMFQAPFSEYIRLYGTVAPYLKEKFPHLKIGGYGSCGFYAAVGSDRIPAANSSPRMEHFVECAHMFLSAAKANGWPLDFFSFHSYSEPKEALRQVRFAREILNQYGFAQTETCFNEWLPLPSKKLTGTPHQAAMVAAELIGLQNAPCDSAMIYDARCGVGSYSPLFNPMTQDPHKAYFAFLSFNRLRQLGTAVKASSSDPDLWVAAARKGVCGAIMLANHTDHDIALNLRAEGLKPTSWNITSPDTCDKHVKGDPPTTIPADSFVVVFYDDPPSNGEISRMGVRVSQRFGYDPVDSTRFLQAALDSGEKVLIVDRQAGDWFVRPLQVKGRTDLTLVLEDGVRIVAKRGEFKDPYVPLLTFDRCTNVVIRGASPKRCGFRMWHDDYFTRDKRKPNDKGYMWSEWRHGLSFLSCVGVTLEGISSNDSGGDGLYISTAGRVGSTPGSGAPCENFVIRNCIFDRNNRQGVSVISVRGLLMEDTLLSNTFGTAPEAGIDFEPNRPDETITGVVMRRCRSVNNEGSGFEFNTSRFDRTSEPTDALFEDCSAVSNRFGFAYTSQRESALPEEPMNHGKFVISHCRFVGSREHGLMFLHRPFSTGSLVVRNTVLEDNCTKNPARTDMNLTVSAHGVYEPDTYHFENVTIIRPKPGKVINVTRRTKPYNGKPSFLRGAVKAVVSGKEETLVFDERWNAEHSPYRTVTDSGVARVPADLDEVEVVDTCPGRTVEIAHPPFFRSSGRGAVFFADRAKEVHFKLQQTLIGKRDYRAPYLPVRVYPLNEKRPVDPAGVTMPVDPEGAIISFRVPVKGFYRLSLVPGGNGVAVLATDVPLAYDATENYVNFVAPAGGPASRFRNGTCELSVFVPSWTDFSFLHRGEGIEMVGVEVVDPSGKVVQREDALADLNALTFRNALGGIWTFRLFKPDQGEYEDFGLAVSGVPGWLFVTPEKIWKQKEQLKTTHNKNDTRKE